MARMRYAHDALKLIQEEDPNTAITLHHIRELARTEKIKVHKVGAKRRLINVDDLLAYLSRPADPAGEDQENKIRRVPERGEVYEFMSKK